MYVYIYTQLSGMIIPLNCAWVVAAAYIMGTWSAMLILALAGYPTYATRGGMAGAAACSSYKGRGMPAGTQRQGHEPASVVHN